MNLTVQDLLRQDARIKDLYFNISEIKLSITSLLSVLGVNLTVQDLFRQDAKIQDLYLNISEMKLSITPQYNISDAPKYDIIWTENSDVIGSFISEILKYKSWILASLS